MVVNTDNAEAELVKPDVASLVASSTVLKALAVLTPADIALYAVSVSWLISVAVSLDVFMACVDNVFIDITVVSAIVDNFAAIVSKFSASTEHSLSSSFILLIAVLSPNAVIT